MKRFFDIIFSLAGLIILSPVMIFIAILIKISSKGPVIYKGNRIGKYKKIFRCLKFRTMITSKDGGSITIGDRDKRITKIGYLLRKTKVDELPQLFNVLRGDMSFVGPRPDVPGYENFYEKEFKNYYQYKPGITSPSSIYFTDEAELYVDSENPEKIYIKETIPKKVKLDRDYLENITFIMDIKIIIKTLVKIITR